MITHHKINYTNSHIRSNSADKAMIINILEGNTDKATSIQIAPPLKVERTNHNIIEV